METIEANLTSSPRFVPFGPNTQIQTAVPEMGDGDGQTDSALEDLSETTDQIVSLEEEAPEE
jgi:hypothetical protein